MARSRRGQKAHDGGGKAKSQDLRFVSGFCLVCIMGNVDMYLIIL